MGAELSALHHANGSPPSSSSMTNCKVVEFHSSAQWKAHFEFSKDTTKLMVIDFTALWCAPCRFMEPTINAFAAKYTDVEFIKIDVDEMMDVAQEFCVQAMPTFVLIKRGEIVDNVTGAKKEELQNKIEKHMA
ncbi:thioredoxin H2-like [Actinidia eriantha]|uniref:thioredoxin H2-like n=1 Tax=Actinidia eriantha TaxID=165200 RepID=UPI00258E6C4E|nr:thioredoxin H2-like [Actinidia eriantha]